MDRATKVFDRGSRTAYDPRSYRRKAWQNYDMTEWGTGRPELLAALGLEDEGHEYPVWWELEKPALDE
jgi:para-nitrobenzyl esterase